MKILLVGHDNYGSREIFSKIIDTNPSNEYFLFITTGLYYKKNFFQSVFKLLKEASFIFCFLRFFDMLTYRIKGDLLWSRALKKNIKTFFIKDINSSETIALVKELEIDILVSMFTMHIYRKNIIECPKFGAIGTHPSILPDYRGLEVFFWQLANKETESGVSVFNLSEKIDQGEVIMQEKFKIDHDETVVSIYEKLTELTAKMMADAISIMCNGKKIPILYKSSKGRYYPMPTSESFKNFLKSGHKWR